MILRKDQLAFTVVSPHIRVHKFLTRPGTGFSNKWSVAVTSSPTSAAPPHQCLLVIKERQAGHSQRPDWVLNKPLLDFSAGCQVLTGLALRRPSKRSHGRPCV